MDCVRLESSKEKTKGGANEDGDAVRVDGRSFRDQSDEGGAMGKDALCFTRLANARGFSNNLR